MSNARKPSKIREKELRLALLRIQHGRSQSGATQPTIAAVAREAGVSTALIHNHYPRIAEAIREAQGRASRAQRDVKQQELRTERSKNRELRIELENAHLKLATLASLNENLLAEIYTLKSNLTPSRVINLVAK